jgi:tRNA nucleotidyltransferase/poly(A) polymerase
MFKKIKNTILKVDKFLYKIFGSDKSTKILENIKEAQLIFSNLNNHTTESNVRFVGGCVRKAINGENIDDIDLATSLQPEEVKRLLNKKNIKVIDTGILHGTVTVIINKKKFEITTLRKDISTDGRHANIEYISSGKEDSERRDFTVNAIYSDIEGRVYDPLNGISDLKNGIIRFIGNTEKRIQEDYLRILRYFRFFAHYSKIDFDQKTISTIKKNINGINRVSNERILEELRKILKLKNCDVLFSNNMSNEILLNIFPQFLYYNRLNIIKDLKNSLKYRFDNNLILASLVVDSSDSYEYFCHKYKVSNNIRNRFKNISKNYKNLENNKFYLEKNLKKLIYFLGKEYVQDLLLFSLLLNTKRPNINMDNLIDYVSKTKIPKFPISGDILMEYGYDTGVELGKKLKRLKEQWVENNFIIDDQLVKKTLGNLKEN